MQMVESSWDLFVQCQFSDPAYLVSEYWETNKTNQENETDEEKSRIKERIL
jgi:hypothetical protein